METIQEYTLDNGILRLTAINYGACITGIYVPDRKGKRENVVARFAQLSDYVTQSGPYLNAVVGPYAGRIAYGHSPLSPHSLSINCGKHHLHGGICGISMRYFQVKQYPNRLCFSLCAEHEQDGYPSGTYHYEIEYRLDQDALIITLHATPPAPSLLSMTNHLYFNLAPSDKSDIWDHALRLDATHRGRIHADGHPCEIVAIQKQDPYDFKTLCKISERYNKENEELAITNGYDTPFLLGKDGVTLYHAQSGRCMDITGDAQSVVVYTANAFDETLCLNEGQCGKPHRFIALELQRFPNESNLMDHPQACLFDETHPFHQVTTYRFHTQDPE